MLWLSLRLGNIVAIVAGVIVAVTSLTLMRTRSAEAVPTEPSKTTVVPSDLSARNHVAVPVASAALSCVIAFAVATPATADAKAGLPKRSSARSTWAPSAVSAVAGWVPS